ncbi:MAG: hypothetical protein ACFFG0_02625 [Candidatus Thorarchaeota archaeon]
MEREKIKNVSVFCYCPECKEVIEFKTEIEGQMVYLPGTQIPPVVAHAIKGKNITCKCGCFCEPEFVEYKSYIVRIR